MKIHSAHERLLNGTADEVGALLDGLKTEDDKLWPGDRWPSLDVRLDGPLEVGAVAGNDQLQFRVVAYEPGRRVRFDFRDSRGIDGFHEYEVVAVGPTQTLLKHHFEAELSGLAIVRWPVTLGPMLDAVVQDSLDGAAAALAGEPLVRRTLPRPMRVLRAISSRGREKTAA